MDFVQRNLINERNNLQVELAKAKLLIAELSEAYSPKLAHRHLPGEGRDRSLPPTEDSTIDKAKWKAIGNRTSERKGFVSNKKENLVSDNVQGLSDPAAVRTQQARDASFKKPISEEAEYISDLENVIVSIAEQLGVDPNDLLNEVRAVTNAEIAANPVKNARNINRIQAVVDRIHNRTQMPGMHSPIGARKDAYDSERAKHMLGALGVKAAVRTGGIGVKVASDRRPNEAGEALTRDTNVQMGSNDGLRANDALKSNIMTANKAARPAGPVADTRQRQPKGMSTFLPRSL
jgi:hypothetical protein